MYINLKNYNYGYSTATFGDYVAVANPAILRYNPLSSSVAYTGSVDYFRYNKGTNQHDYVGPLYVNLGEANIYLAAESGSVPSLRDPFLTELNNTGSTFNKLIEIDKNLYTSSLEDGFGVAMDMYEKLLVVGSPYSLYAVNTSASFFSSSNIAIINVFDLSLTEKISLVTQSAFVFSETNPDTQVTNSFGLAVSINENWIAVGSPYVSQSNGMVYIYQNTSTGSNYNWTLTQKIQASGSINGALFGQSLKLNKQSGSYSGSLIVGCGNISSNQAFYFEYINGLWQQTHIFNADTNTIYPLTFGGFNPYTPTLNTGSGYGHSVSIFGDTVVVGEYLDRNVYEFSGSSLYNQGSVSIYEKCNTNQSLFNLVLKTYGTSSIMKNNYLGYSVDIYGDNIIAGIPKINNNSMTSYYIEGTLQQFNQCNNNVDDSALESSLNGQAILLQKNTSSMQWDITNIYQRKKRFLSPYKCFGDNVSIGDFSMVVGAPLIISDNVYNIDINITQSGDVMLDDVSGKAYIYNLSDLWGQFHVGNVFYRNGKVVLMTSGSIYDELFSNSINTNQYEYDLKFKGQQTIWEKQIICSVNPGEFNVSTNPSAIFIPSSSLDINQNGIFDFQDVDVILRYMQYKSTSILGATISTDWSSSIVTKPDEISVLNYYLYTVESPYDVANTATLTSASIIKWETTETWMQDILDLNGDNTIDSNDMNIAWKYFINRLTSKNYDSYTTPSSTRKLYSDVVDYLNWQSKRNYAPQINSSFNQYAASTALDKTGSFLAPMATTIGLYSGLDLVMVAKLGSPIKITPELPINFAVKIDF